MSDVRLAHERAFELLPWLVNGSLSGSDRDAVEQHVRGCIVCRREIKHQRRLHATVRAQPDVHVSAAMDYGRLADALDDDRGRGAAAARAYAPLFRFGTVAALGLGFLALLLWLVPQNTSDPATYTTLAAARAADAQIDVVFGAETTAAEIQQLLDAIGGEIVAGPTEVGRYGIRVGDDPAGRNVELALERLAADPHVRFAGRTFAEAP